jgi:hypothetical protein
MTELNDNVVTVICNQCMIILIQQSAILSKSKGLNHLKVVEHSCNNKLLREFHLSTLANALA